VDIRFSQLLLDLADPRQQLQQTAHAAHAPDLAQLRSEIVEVEPTLFQFGGKFFRLLLIDRLGRLLDEADDVAHPEYATGNALGVERLERLDPFADPHQHDGPAGDGAHRQCRAAAGIAVDPGQHDPGDAGALAEGLGDIYRIL